MDLKEHVKLFLSFSKKERLGIGFLFLIYGMLWVLPFFFIPDPVNEEVSAITPLQVERGRQVLRDAQKNEYGDGRNTDGTLRNGGKRYVHHTDSGVRPVEKKKGFVSAIDINRADSATFESLPGIGEKLSSRIVRYRDRLGGFISVDQLTEVYGLQDSVLQRFVQRLNIETHFQPRKININKADYKELRRHPYVSHVLAKSIIAYRQTHGNFKEEEALFRMASADPEEIKRILPYCSFEE